MTIDRQRPRGCWRRVVREKVFYRSCLNRFGRSIGSCGAILGIMLASAVCVEPATAGVAVFFNPGQVATLISTGTTSDTISSGGYRFTYTRDKLFTGGVGLTNPIGRSVRVPWPSGIEAQYVTSGPNPAKASITVRREDGAVFGIHAFTAQLLANAGAGRAIEIVPLLNGEEVLPDPLYFDVSGMYGQKFSYDASPNHLGSTAALTGYDSYKINLTLDYALTALTLESPAPDPNHPPTDLILDPASIVENEPAGTCVGSFQSTDPDTSDTFTYTLVDGVGSDDNARFSITGDQLMTGASFNFEAVGRFTLRVETTDQGGLSFQKVLAVDVIDVVEPEPTVTMEMDPMQQRIVLVWEGIPNHTYTVYRATNLVDGFVMLQDHIPYTAGVNSFTGIPGASAEAFWSVSMDP